MNKEKMKKNKLLSRKNRVRAIISGTADRPRLSVFRSNKSAYVQLIDDQKRVTLVAAHSRELDDKKLKSKVAISFELGKLIANKALKVKIKKVIFDRGGYKYHGRVQAIANGAREGGLEF